MTAPASPDPEHEEKGTAKPKRRSGGRSKARSGKEDGERDGLLAALQSGLEAALPGLEVVDRDLVLDERGRADLAAVDPSGRLVLAIVAEEDGERTVLDALDSLAFARRNAEVLARHLDRRIDAGLQPRIVVIDPANTVALVERLAPLAPLGVEVFGVQTIRSAAGERSYLVAREAPDSIRAPAERGVEAFLQALPDPLLDLGRELAERMARLDDDLIATGDKSALVWRWNGEILVRLEHVGERLQGSVGPHHRPGPVQRADDVERLVESALGRLVQCLEGHASPAEGEDEEGVERPAGDEPLLTAEEIEAFRD